MRKNPTLLAALLLVAPPASAATIYIDEFDGVTNAYFASPDAAGSSSGWVDFEAGATNTAGRITSTTVGTVAFSEGFVSGVTGASGGSVLQGVSNGNDPQVRSQFGSPIVGNLADVTTITLRLRIDVNKDGIFNDALSPTSFSLYYGESSYVSPGAQNATGGVNRLLIFTTLVAQGSDFFYVATYSGLDLTNGGAITGGLASLRIDPTNGSGGNGSPFEIDRLTVVSVPEPTGASILLSGLVVLLVRRRR